MIDDVVATLSGEGSIAGTVTCATITESTPAPSVRAVDTTGAGDVFSAGLVHSLLRERPMPQALETAAAWGAAAAAFRGLPPQETIQGLL